MHPLLMRCFCLNRYPLSLWWCPSSVALLFRRNETQRTNETYRLYIRSICFRKSTRHYLTFWRFLLSVSDKSLIHIPLLVALVFLSRSGTSYGSNLPYFQLITKQSNVCLWLPDCKKVLRMTPREQPDISLLDALWWCVSVLVLAFIFCHCFLLSL